MKYDLVNDDLIKICKTASIEELYELCDDIREFLLDKVSRTGGHLASNLGIAELSVALTRVFNMPKDRIIYDVGHQTYVHKILTGRAEGFDTLRQYNGMSGFPKSRESIYDAYDTGHSSTSIGAAYGIAIARDLSGDDYNVVAVIGDGSFTGGIVYEALNNIGAKQTNINIILNDNGMSISRNVGAMSKYLTKLRSSEKYDQAKSSVKSALQNVPVIGNPIKKSLKNSKEKIRYSILSSEGHLIEDLGIKYFGPVDGYNIQEMSEVLAAAAKYDGPTLIHVITTKGKGYYWSEKYPRKFHGIGPFDVESGELLNNSNEPSFSKIFGEKLASMADNDNNIVAIAAAMGTATGLTKMYERHEDRYFDVGIAEEHAVIFAAGLAKNGYKPYIAIYSSFLQRAFDYIIEDVALQNLHVVFCIDRAGLVGADGETHHGVFDISYMSMVPNMTIFAPADGMQLEEILEYSDQVEGPVAIRYPRGSSVGKHLRLKKFKGNNNVISEGADVTILAVGSMLDEAIAASEILKEDGYSVGIINVCVVKPQDDTFDGIKSKLVVTIEDNIIRGGFGEAFNNQYSRSNFDVLTIGVPDKFIEHGSIPELRKEIGIDADGISRKVKEYFEGKA